MKIVVLPAPVGRETPMRVVPARSAAWHASRQDCWYGRKTNCADLAKPRRQ